MKRYFHWLDTLRAVAMLAVLVTHFRNALFPAYGEVSHGIGTVLFYGLTRWGHSAVIVFFALSGFLVGGRAMQAVRTGMFRLEDYVLARVVRIGLPLIFACTLTVGTFVALGIPIPWRVVMGNLLCMQGLACGSLLGPWWALSIEVWFYVFGGALLGGITMRGWKQASALCVCVVMLGVFACGYFEYLMIWCLGAMTYLWLPRKTSSTRLILSLLAFAIVLGCLVRWSLPDFVLGVVCCAVIREISLWDSKGPIASRVEGVFNWLAKFSYTTYLLHMLIMVVLMNCLFTCGKDVVMMDKEHFNVGGHGCVDAFSNLTLTALGWYLFALLVAIVVSYGGWWLVERNTGVQRDFYAEPMTF